MKKTTYFLGFTLCILLLATSCGKSDHVSVSRDRFLFDMNGGAIAFNITANCDWKIEVPTTASWISLSQDEGRDNATVTINVRSNADQIERSEVLTVVSTNGKSSKKIYVQQKTNINVGLLVGNIWFLRFYERWDLDYYNQIIDESYRTWTYYIGEEFEDWFFYFNDTVSYLIYAYDNDTVYFPYHYVYYPENDSLNLSFETVNDSLESYFAYIHELSNERFTISNEYKHNRFEKLYTLNATNNNRSLKINPKKVMKKPSGPLIPFINHAH